MIISLSPKAWTRPAERLVASVSGDVLTINGGALDFSFLQDGESLPASATNCPFISGKVHRIGADIHVTLIQKHSSNAPQSARYPAGPQNVTDGEVAIPQVASDDEVLAGLEDAAQAPQGGWTLDEGAKTTTAAKAADALSLARSEASLSRVEFALACERENLMTKLETLDWLGAGTLPASVQTALVSVGTQQAFEVTARFIASNSIARLDPFLLLLQQEMGLTDNKLDAIFGI